MESIYLPTHLPTCRFQLRMAWSLGVLRLKFRINNGEYELHRKVDCVDVHTWVHLLGSLMLLLRSYHKPYLHQQTADDRAGHQAQKDRDLDNPEDRSALGLVDLLGQIGN